MSWGKRALMGALTMASALMPVTTAAQQEETGAARALLEDAAEALGGLERLQDLENFVLTGFGQRYSFNGNVSPSPQAPPKWQAVTDARRSFDLDNERALNQERNSFMYPLAASFGHSWALANTLQSGADMLDHPVPAVLEALDAQTTLGPVTTEEGQTVIQFTLEGGETLWLALDPRTRLPSWVRRIEGDATLGDVAHTTYFTGYVPYDGIELPLGLMARMDWRDQPTLMFQVDSYRVNVDDLPAFPDAAEEPGGQADDREVVVTPIAEGVWDLRLPSPAPGSRGGDGGAVVEFEDHLVMFEAYGSEAETFARIDAANQLVPGKEVTRIIVTHHHADHAAGLRGAVSRGITLIGERENRPLYEEWVSRSAANFPDALARNPRALEFMPVDDALVLEDGSRRLEVYQVVGHAHMGNAVFAYLPEERILLEGDLSDVNWEWHWWAGALQANIDHYGLDPVLNVPVHGEVLGIEDTLAHIREQAEAAQAFCARNEEAGIPFFGCPVRYSAAGPISGED